MERIRFSRPEQWRNWLRKNHSRSPGAWLITFRKGRGPFLAPADANGIALEYGWYDAFRSPVDEMRIQHLYRPRRQFTPWSAHDRFETTKKIDTGSIHRAGLRVARAAQMDGSWSISDRAHASLVPLDLCEALDRRPETRSRFDILDPRVKNQLLKQLSVDSRWQRGTRPDLIDQVLITVDQINPTEPWWADAPAAKPDHIELAISVQNLAAFGRVHQTAGLLALIGPPGLSKSWSASQFVNRHSNSAAFVHISDTAAASWPHMQRALTKAARSLGATRPHVSDRVAGFHPTFALASALTNARRLGRGTLCGPGIVADNITFLLDDAQRLSEETIRGLVGLNDALESEPVGLILIGTPDLAQRLDATERSVRQNCLAMQRRTLTVSDLTSQDMQRALMAWGVAEVSDQEVILERLRGSGTWSLRALKRLVG